MLSCRRIRVNSGPQALDESRSSQRSQLLEQGQARSIFLPVTNARPTRPKQGRDIRVGYPHSLPIPPLVRSHRKQNRLPFVVAVMAGGWRQGSVPRSMNLAASSDATRKPSHGSSMGVEPLIHDRVDGEIMLSRFHAVVAMHGTRGRLW